MDKITKYHSSNEIIVDLFAGGGGASTGIEKGLRRKIDIAINHDPRAIEMHKKNHPDTRHYIEDVFAVDPVVACAGKEVALLWASPDCTHFSKAKGAKPVSKKIRSLAWVVAKWASKVNPRVIMLENVEEFQTWGPIGKDNMPIKERKGETFKQFIEALKNIGYKVEWKILKACDFGAPTIRKRLFLIARCDGNPIVWPNPTHGKSLKPYRTAAEVIDFDLPALSIFDRKKPLSENTMKRIARGLEKFVFKNPQPYIVQIGQTGFGKNKRVQSIDEPLRTITRKNEHCLITPIVADYHFQNNGNTPNDPLSTITSVNSKALLIPQLIQMGYPDNEGKRILDLKKPLGSIMAGGNKFALVSAFISKRFGDFGKTVQAADIERPLPTVTASDHNQLITANFIERTFSSSIGHKIDEPLGTITANDKSRLVQAFLIKYFGGENNNQSIDEPLHTITSKDRFGLVTIQGKDYQIVDIAMRMLEPKELYLAQGFPKDYKYSFISANGKPYPKSEQVAKVGNSVSPVIPEALVKANLSELVVMPTQNIETMMDLKQVFNYEEEKDEVN